MLEPRMLLTHGPRAQGPAPMGPWAQGPGAAHGPGAHELEACGVSSVRGLQATSFRQHPAETFFQLNQCYIFY